MKYERANKSLVPFVAAGGTGPTAGLPRLTCSFARGAGVFHPRTPSPAGSGEQLAGEVDQHTGEASDDRAVDADELEVAPDLLFHPA